MRQFSAMTEGITKGIIAHLRDNSLSTQLPGSKGIVTWSEPQRELLESTDRFTKAVEVVLGRGEGGGEGGSNELSYRSEAIVLGFPNQGMWHLNRRLRTSERSCTFYIHSHSPTPNAHPLWWSLYTCRIFQSRFSIAWRMERKVPTPKLLEVFAQSTIRVCL